MSLVEQVEEYKSLLEKGHPNASFSQYAKEANFHIDMFIDWLVDKQGWDKEEHDILAKQLEPSPRGQIVEIRIDDIPAFIYRKEKNGTSINYKNSGLVGKKNQTIICLLQAIVAIVEQ